MSNALCPKCNTQGQCQHNPGIMHGGVFYDEYSFRCSNCGHNESREFPIDHAGNACPFCGRSCNELATDRGEIDQDSRALAGGLADKEIAPLECVNYPVDCGTCAYTLNCPLLG